MSSKIKLAFFAPFWFFLLLNGVSAQQQTKQPKDNSSVIDELNGSSIGETFGITYTDAVDGKGVVFSRNSESRIQYPTQTPTEGTLEWWINVKGGYVYSDYKLNQSQTNALIFTTAGGDVWYPGSTWFSANADGTLTLDMATTKYDGPKQTLIARNTKFRFNQWHLIGISFGSQGQYIMLDGVVVASSLPNTQKLGRGGTHETANDIPTFGEMVSGFWANNRYDAGFEGILDKIRISKEQKDWALPKPYDGIKTAATSTKTAIRKVDFRNFTYNNVKHPDDELVDITVSKGKYNNGDQGSYNSWDFVINEIVYGDITNDGQEDALVRATLTTYGSSNPASLDSAYFFLYTSGNGALTRITDIDVWKDYEPFSNFQSGCEELILDAKIKAVSSGKAILNLLITGIECSHKGFTITANYAWKDNKLILVGKPIKTRTR